MEFETFAVEWLAAWNAKDLDLILAHYDHAVVFTSPYAARLLPHSCGVIHGIEDLRSYWSVGLSRSPNLNFELNRVLHSAGGGTVLYTNHEQQLVAETMLLDGAGKVRIGVASYPAGSWQ